MIIGVPREIKTEEYRVAMIPAGVETLKQSGHRILIEQSAGAGIGVSDEEYEKAGAEIISHHGEVIRQADLVVKVKEPLPSEYEFFRPGQIVFGFFHFPGNQELLQVMIARRIIAIAYETVEKEDGSLPLLTPMSEIAGRLAVQEGAKYLERPSGGRGMLLGGAPGVPPAEVVILGGGVVGSSAAGVAAALGARVTVLDIDPARLKSLAETLPPNVVTLFCRRTNLIAKVKEADLLIGAVLVKGARAPILVSREMVRSMKPGSVIVDVAIDQGGCVETSHPTSHREPIFVQEGVIHYCVPNIPGAVPLTSTYALVPITLPYILEIANKGFLRAVEENRALGRGVNLVEGKVVHPGVAQVYDLPCYALEEVLINFTRR